MPEKVATVILSGKPNLLLETGENKDGSYWVALTNKTTKNKRYLEKSLTTSQVGTVLAGYLALLGFRRKCPLTKRKDIIKYLREAIINYE